MTELSPATAQASQPVDCVCYRLRRAARKAAKFYDSALKISGLRNTQFTLLGALDRLGDSSIGTLSEELAIDGTTLTRNLEVLVRRGLVENIEAEDGRVRNLRLTDFGRKRFEEALPVWHQAQQQMLEALGTDQWRRMRSSLNEIEAACDRKR